VIHLGEIGRPGLRTIHSWTNCGPQSDRPRLVGDGMAWAVVST
jgi:hypothetical protein